ncbi:related to kinesin light chain [Phialocephala subalpina]|uniref:Related to kinesin light chain n=1 Tax=Phialocephala subalpina TaxID=576137 RepID=A0A1L7XST3_9HELO|nr:related to kinesin light chain [Phialocephala subalpina]
MASVISFGDANAGFQAGIINGSANVVFNAPPEQPETPPNPSIVIPFSRDTDFVERRIFDQIHQKCAVLGSRTALVGLGGVGKSQLAIEYAYRTQDLSPETWVFWVHASNAARFEQSFREIANCVKISGRQNPQANIFQLVHDWLRDDRKGRWVLILDNVDDAGFLIKDQSTSQDGHTKGDGGGNLQPLTVYLPRSLNGSILITTRSKSAARTLVDEKNIIAIEPMSAPDALALLEKKLGWHDDAVELAAVLEYMPLAIAQAAAYISQRAPRYSVREYLQDFQKSERKRASLLNHEGEHEGEQLRRDREAKNSIIITWQISFDHIREIRPSAADLLSLMSFFDRQGIPEALLRSRDEQRNSRYDQKENNDDNHTDIDASYSDDDEDNGSRSSVNNGFEDDLLALRNYSFISVNMDGITFEMHGLVQLATREWLKASKQQERWKQQFIKNLCAELPTGEYENWVKCQALFPHAQSAITQQPDEDDALRDWASILYKAAWYAWQMGKGVEAEKMSVQAMKVRKKILGREHNDTLNSMAMVGLAYELRGQWDAAEELQVQVMETSKTKLGADHLNTLTSMVSLSLTYWNQGRWDAAKELQVQVIETRKTKLGADHLYTLTSIANLASTYREQGRWDAAEELEVQVIETLKKKLGTDHPNTLSSINNLASTYQKQGRWDAAEELEVQVIETSKKKLGADHPDTLTSIANLAVTFWNQGRWDAAEELEVQVMETRKKKLGADHPNTLTSMNNLAATFWNQGRWDAAKELFMQVIETSKKKLGADHPNTLTSMDNLASTYREQGRWDAAEELEVQVIETRKKKLGADHPNTLTSMDNLASTYREQGRWDAAEELEVQVIETRKKKLGADHPNTLTSMNNLAFM